MNGQKDPCGCDEKQALKGRSFLYDRTGYNVAHIATMSESQFVDHPMHNHNYTDLPTQDRIAQLKKVFKAIMGTIEPVKIETPIVSIVEKEVAKSNTSEPETDVDGTHDI